MDSFHRDRVIDPKDGMDFYSGTSPWFYISPPASLEPLRKAFWKHLTFKMVFLLALGSGKVVIPALAPTLDKSLKEDRSLCPVRALRYYLDKTQDLRPGKELVFVSFKKGFSKDTCPTTISSWIKQTIVLCYELSD